MEVLILDGIIFFITMYYLFRLNACKFEVFLIEYMLMLLKNYLYCSGLSII
jgi:hypothetical protein